MKRINAEMLNYLGRYLLAVIFKEAAIDYTQKPRRAVTIELRAFYSDMKHGLDSNPILLH